MYIKFSHLFLLEIILVEKIIAEFIGESPDQQKLHIRKKRWLLFPPGANIVQVHNFFIDI